MRFILLLLILVGSLAAPAAAHQLVSDHGVSAVLHIPPDDNPVAGRDTILALSFSSQRPGFDLGYCRCIVSYQGADGRQQTASVSADSGSTDSGQAVVRFDQAGPYNLYVRGQASTDPTDRFQLQYVLRVADDGANPANRRQAGLQVGLLGVTSLILLGLIASAAIRRGNRYG